VWLVLTGSTIKLYSEMKEMKKMPSFINVSVKTVSTGVIAKMIVFKSAQTDLHVDVCVLFCLLCFGASQHFNNSISTVYRSSQ